MISQFAVCLPIGCAARLLPFASSLSTIYFLNSSSTHSDLTVFKVIFLMGACFLLNGISKVCLLLTAHHGPSNILYINNIGIKTKRIVWPLYTIWGPAFWTVIFLGFTTSDGSQFCFQAHFCIRSKDVIPTCWWFHSSAVFNYTGRLTDNLNQVTGTGYSLKLFLEWAARWKPVNI